MDSPGGLMVGFGCMMLCLSLAVAFIISAIRHKKD